MKYHTFKLLGSLGPVRREKPHSNLSRRNLTYRSVNDEKRVTVTYKEILYDILEQKEKSQVRTKLEEGKISLEKGRSAQQKAEACTGLARLALAWSRCGSRRPHPPEFRWEAGDQSRWHRVQWDPGVSGNRRSAGHMGLADIMTDLCGHPGHRQAVCRLHAAVTSVSRGLWKGFAWSQLPGARGSHPGPVSGAVSPGCPHTLPACNPLQRQRACLFLLQQPSSALS